MTVEENYAHLYTLRIKTSAEALAGFAQAYLEVNEQDTSPAERAKLVEVDELLARALDRFV
jgi:hypothetical protein